MLTYFIIDSSKKDIYLGEKYFHVVITLINKLHHPPKEILVLLWWIVSYGNLL